MPKRAKELSARAVVAIKADGMHAVGGVAGLHLRVRGQSRSWVLRVVVGDRRREFGLGSYPEVSLALARDLAWQRRRARLLPAIHRVTLMGSAARTPDRSDQHEPPESPPQESKTFDFCARTYVAAQTPGWKSDKHGKQWLATLEKYAFPVLAKRDVATITTAHVVEVLKPIWTTKTETASRLRGRIENILDWAAHRAYRSGKNPASWKGNLKHELPSATKLKKRKKRHHPALPYARIATFMADLRSHHGASAWALEWGILTAARSQEIRGARRSEVDLKLRRWTIPAERMKLEKEHVVPLSFAALTLFESLPIIEGNDLLFPAHEGGMLCDAAFGSLIDRMHEADIERAGIGYLDPKQDRVATAHGFRSTFRDWAAEVAIIPREVAEHALAHKLRDEAEAAYQRGELLGKRAVLMEQWAQFCEDTFLLI